MVAFEGAGEGGLGLIAHGLGHCHHPEGGVGQEVGGQLHAPLSEVLYR